MAVETAYADASGPVGSTFPVASAETSSPAEASEASVTDEFELALTAAFGPVTRWWVRPDGLRLPLP